MFFNATIFSNSESYRCKGKRFLLGIIDSFTPKFISWFALLYFVLIPFTLRSLLYKPSNGFDHSFVFGNVA